MTNHAKVFLESRGISGKDPHYCEYCGKGVMEARDLGVHHIRYRSMGGTDEETNLLGVCSDCHDYIHANNISEDAIVPHVKDLLNYLRGN